MGGLVPRGAGAARLAAMRQPVQPASSVANSDPVANTVANEHTKPVSTAKRKPGQYADKEARKAYMREYMRKARTKAD